MKRTQINNLEQKEEINIQPEQNEETRIQKKKKNEERLKNLQDNFKHSNIQINHKGARGGRGRTRNWKLIWKTSEGELSQYGKGNRHAIQEAQRVPRKLDPKRTTPRHIIIKMPNVKDKDRILKAARENQSYLQKSSPKTIKKFLKRNFAGKKYAKWWKARIYNVGYSIQQSYHLEWKAW